MRVINGNFILGYRWYFNRMQCFLILRGRSFPVVVGITMLSYAVNLFLFSTGRLTIDGAPIYGTQETYADPLPQALVLTAIVIGFAMTAYSIILAVRA